MKRCLIICFALLFPLILASLAAAETSRQDYLDVTIDGIVCTLGKSTIEDLTLAGWSCDIEDDGMYALVYDDPEFDGVLYARTKDGTIDAPVIYMDLVWADGVQTDYCGFNQDGIREADDMMLWDWLTEIGAEETEEGSLSVTVSTGDGKSVQIETDDIRVRLTLVGS